jgi:Outer membrane protein beta-barrel domain
MNKLLATLGLALAAMTCAPAQAGDRYGGYDRESAYPYGLYFGVSGGEFIYREDGINALRPGIVEFRIGQELNPYLALEGRLGGGLGSDQSQGYRASVQALYAGYVKGILPMTPWLSGYALAGVAGVELHRNYPDFNTSDAGVSFGVGAEFKLQPRTSLTLEWVRLLNGTNDHVYDYTADQVAVGINWRW